ncbi:T6SS immunity protein Tli4 family protein [Pantoea coffeiphila]|uniref:T6SS immunity protein Tli4 family protein n=1 Tax=Pantoea coffeiphila TaxID=1465635 RepID=UPI001961A699|nr:T6SS immunity protein Tli4 family protein [Pantoea coffeiphila]MBM7344024.1 hypothetical protein [Pantoea coffeiphila]
MNAIRQITALSLMAGSLYFIAPATASTLMQKDSSVIDTLFAQTKPQCIGRYVIGVPESFNNQLHDMIFIDDFKIESKPLYPPAFKQRVQLREQALHDAVNKPENKPENAPFLKEVIILPDGRGVIFDHNESGTPDIYRKLEAHVYVNMVAFMITANFRDFSGEKNKQDKIEYLSDGFTEADANTKPAKLVALKSLISRLSGRKDDGIPVAKGICIPNGFIHDDGEKHREKITFSYENDDFILGVYTNNTYMGSDDTLFNRTAEVEKTLKIANQHTLKKYALSPGGVPAQAWLSGGPQTIDNNVNPLYEFDLYANEADATPAKPWLTIGINNFDKKTRYSQAQMIEIWDRLVNSLRYK